MALPEGINYGELGLFGLIYDPGTVLKYVAFWGWIIKKS